MKNSNYEVGFCKPPAHSRWEKGKSANPKGRPRGSKNTLTLLNMLANEEISIVQNGKTIKLPKKAAALLQAINMAAKGDKKALAILLPHLLAADVKAEDHAAKLHGMSRTDKEILTAFLEQNKPTKGDKDV